MADRHAREEVRQRALMQQKIAQKEKEAKEENLRMLAQRAREERSGVVVQPSAGAAAASMGGDLGGALAGYGSGSDSEDEESAAIARGAQGQRAPSVGDEFDSDSEAGGRPAAGGEEETEEERRAAKEREEMRRERRKEREREMRMSHMGTEQRAKVLAKWVSLAPVFVPAPEACADEVLVHPCPQSHRSRHFGKDCARSRQADHVQGLDARRAAVQPRAVLILVRRRRLVQPVRQAALQWFFGRGRDLQAARPERRR